MNRNNNYKTLDEKKKELASFKSEWKKMVEQEKELKKQFYASPKNSLERKDIKNRLTRFQKEMFEKKWSCGKSMSRDVRNEKMIQKLENPTGPATDPHHLAELIKKELREVLDGSRKFEVGDTAGDIWEANRSREICYFGREKKVNELIANLTRNRQKPLDPDKITTRMVRVKQEDFSAADFNEMISLVRQVKDFLEVKDKQDRQKTENIKLNNPHLFTQWKCSTDGKYNGRGKWENWHTFSGKHNGFNYCIYVPDNHFALTNALFNDGWGTNSEVSKFFVVKGVAKPTALHYWNVAKQRNEIISEAKAQSLIKQGKGNYINYETYVELSDKITIDHYQENGQQDLVKPVSGINQEVENDNHQNMSESLITNETENIQSPEIDTEFLLKFFQEHDIKKISLTPERELLIEYSNGRVEISGKINNPELQKLISYYQKNNQTSLSQSDLVSLNKTNPDSVKKPSSAKAIISTLIIGTLIVGTVVGILVRKQKSKSKK